MRDLLDGFIIRIDSFVSGDINIILKYILAWFPMVFIGIANASIRVYGYRDLIGELRAHQLSTVTGIILFGIYIWLVTSRWRLRSSGQAWSVGFIWLGMTVVFEFIFGHFVMGNSWERLLHDYNLLEGRIWILVLLWLVVAPYLFFRLNTGRKG